MMSRAVSISTRRRYGRERVLKAFEVPRATFYRNRAQRGEKRRVAGKRGPRTKYTDAELLAHVRVVLDDSPFTGEGHRKVWARLRHKGIRSSKARLLRLMREAGLLAPSRTGGPRGPLVHDGTITTERPNEMWGTDLTTTVTIEDGQVAVFAAIDHCTAECVGIHTAKEANRFQALEPVRQGVRERFGEYGEGVAKGLALRHDHGSAYMSADFQDEIDFLGIESSPAFVRAPEGNGCAERFFRTLKEQLLWVRVFRDVEELRVALREWVRTYNDSWILERHGYRTPIQARQVLDKPRLAA